MTFRGYCDECIEFFKQIRVAVHERQRPAPNVIADGKFADGKECPRTVFDPVCEVNVCGLCGSDQIQSGYGLGTGYGIGMYNFCFGCDNFLDFREDTGE